MEVKGEGKKRKTPDARAREACPFFASRCNIFDSGWQAYFKGKEDNLYFQRFYFDTSTYSSTFANKAINKTELFAPHYNAYLSLSLARRFVLNIKQSSFNSIFSPPAPAPEGDFPRSGKETEEHHRMPHYLLYCCAMIFVLISVLLATSQRAQAQTREAYVVQSEDKSTLTFYYDALRATRTGTTWGILERKYVSGEGAFPAWAGTSEEADTTTVRAMFDASFRDFRPTTTACWFCDYRALKQIEGLEYLNTSEVKDMCGMFCGCSALTSLDLQHFNTQNVTDMNSMFFGCAALTSINLKNFNTQNVTDISWMFHHCAALTSIDLNNFNTQNVTDMSWMFSDCAALTSIDLNNFNTKNVTYMRGMFSDCAALTSIDLKNINTQNVTDMSGMFLGCAALTSIDLKNFNTQNVTDITWMFLGCAALTSLDLKNFNTKKVTYMYEMFSGCSALTTINSNTTWQCQESEGMFAGCTKLKGAVSYDKNKVDATMANPETGYFTAKPTMVKSR